MSIIRVWVPLEHRNYKCIFTLTFWFFLPGNAGNNCIILELVISTWNIFNNKMYTKGIHLKSIISCECINIYKLNVHLQVVNSVQVHFHHIDFCCISVGTSKIIQNNIKHMFSANSGLWLQGTYHVWLLLSIPPLP